MVSFEQVDGYCNASTIAQPFFQWAYLAGTFTDEAAGTLPGLRTFTFLVVLSNLNLDV